MADLAIWTYTLVSVFLVSLISLVGIVAVGMRAKTLRKVIIYVISFSAGALLADAFIHLIPEISGDGFGFSASIFVLGGIGIFFVLEKVIHWQHCHSNITDEGHVHPFAYTNLVGDGLHNFIDGLIIAGSFLVSVPTGIATSVAVLLHEIPQEIGDFGVLLHAGFSKSKALLMNFLSALLAVVGAILALALQNYFDGLEFYLVALAAGGFIYIAGSDLIPELHKHSDSLKSSLLQFVAFLVGVGVMVLLLFLE